MLGALAGVAVIFWGLRSHHARVARPQRSSSVSPHIVLLACAAVAVLTTIGIVLSVAFETLRFFSKVSPIDFLFGLQWSPQTAMRDDQVGSSGAFGIVPLIVGTLLITLIAMLVAGPLGLFSAIYMAEYATPRVRAVVKPILEILAGIPTVVLGFFAALTVAPFIRGWGQSIGLDVASESALAAGLVMGMMIIPFVSSLSDDVINAVPQSLRDGSYAMGATKSETIKKVVLPAALPGIVSAFMLAISRAVGETMIVVMAAGLAANLTFNPLGAVTTVTVQIKTLLVGDQEFDSAKTLSAFALGFVLFFFTLALNFIALRSCRDTGNNMTDITAISMLPGRLQRQRRRWSPSAIAAERRFKIYGIAAIAVTAVFLVLLFADILAQGHSGLLRASPGAADQGRSGGHRSQGQQGSQGHSHRRFRHPDPRRFPGAVPRATSRADRKQLMGLLSSGAADDFRAMVVQ